MTPVVGVPPITRDGARSDAQRELAKPIYHRYDDPWPLRVEKWIWHRLGDFVDAVLRHSPGGGGGAFALLVVVLALIAFAQWRFRFVRRDARSVSTVLPKEVASAAGYRNAAAQAAAEERWNDAVVAAMRALARELEERGTIDVRPGRTADELAQEAGALHPAAAASLVAAARTFDAVVYGRRDATRSDYETVSVAAAALDAAPRPLRYAVPA